MPGGEGDDHFAMMQHQRAWQHDQASHLGAQVELGLFHGPMVFSSTWLGSELQGSGTTVRLDSALIVDSPATHSSFKLGDGISVAGDAQHSVRFGGIQWGTDFSTTPEVITFPLPALRGSASVPSTVDL